MNSFTTAIVSHQANEEGPEIINIIGVVLSNLGVVIDQSKMETAELQNTELSFFRICKCYAAKGYNNDEKVRAIRERNGVSCAISTAIIIQQC